MDIGVSSIWVPQFHSGCAALFRGVLVRTHDANGFQMFALSCYDIRMCDFSLSHLKLLNCDNFDIWWHLMMSGYAVWCWKNSRTWCFDAGRGLTVLNAIGARSVGTRSTRPHTLISCASTSSYSTQLWQQIQGIVLNEHEECHTPYILKSSIATRGGPSQFASYVVQAAWKTMSSQSSVH